MTNKCFCSVYNSTAFYIKILFHVNLVEAVGTSLPFYYHSWESRYKKSIPLMVKTSQVTVSWCDRSSGDVGHLHAPLDAPLPLKVCPCHQNNDGYVALSLNCKSKNAFPKEKKVSLAYVAIFILLITYLLWLLFSSPPSAAEQKSRCLLIMAQGKVQQTGSVSSTSIYGCYKNFAKKYPFSAE